MGTRTAARKRSARQPQGLSKAGIAAVPAPLIQSRVGCLTGVRKAPDVRPTFWGTRLLSVSVFVLGGRFHLHVRFIEKMNGLFGVASQVTFVGLVSFMNFLGRFLNVLGGFSEARMRSGIDVVGALCENYPGKNQTSCNQSDQI